jgi:heme oxygenase
MTDLSPTCWTLSRWLAVKTANARETIVECIASHQPTVSEIRCQRLLVAHLQFFHLVSPIYDDANLKRMFFSFLSEQEIGSFKRQLFSRQVEADLPTLLYARRVPGGLLPRLGWLYATEFVDRGLTRLFAETPSVPNVDFNSEASGWVWQAFRDQLDRLELSERDEENLAKAASSALTTYSGFFNTAFEPPQAQVPALLVRQPRDFW